MLFNKERGTFINLKKKAMNVIKTIIIMSFFWMSNFSLCQNIQPPTTNVVFKENIQHINDLIQLEEFDSAISELKILVLKLNNEEEKGFCYLQLFFAYTRKGTLEANLKNYTQAIQYYNSSLNYLNIKNVFLDSLNFPAFETYTNRGICFSKLKNFNNAIDDFNIAISINPSHALAYYNRAIAYHNLGDISTACSDYLKAYKNNYPVERRLIEGCMYMN
jgi:tetratricopeptide (TPR) repeat protein